MLSVSSTGQYDAIQIRACQSTILAFELEILTSDCYHLLNQSTLFLIILLSQVLVFVIEFFEGPGREMDSVRFYLQLDVSFIVANSDSFL